MNNYCFIMPPELYQEIEEHARARDITGDEMLLIILQEYLLPGDGWNVWVPHRSHQGTCDCRVTPAGTFHSLECLEHMAAPLTRRPVNLVD